ncbi:glycosyltransferase family 2 protein [Chryseobacterium sp. POL2]|uniref:glycosyltransferase family 2 protein n=1 Tax=Chryseobacterium sp. POL2 TaxID=2713414 RepID=UPI0013E17900|nr:glycosyltransferase family 2 protein [Chryseobacterium sp. POL2]QIG88363.1 glycosyltransferase family 2 protein [Chryseobacterium sp. POL2]
MKQVSIVIPAYNEEGNLNKIFHEIDLVFKDLKNYNYEIIFVNDGSRDNTQHILEELSIKYPQIKYIEFSRNFGHQFAVKAGVDEAHGQIVISMDADLQHPPVLIVDMIKKWEEGYDMVYTIRKYPKQISYFKKKTSNFFYKLLSAISDVQIDKGSSDFRLMDRKVVDSVKTIGESDLFLRGLAKWVGYKQYAIHFVADQRFSGNSKYNFNKMLKFAFTGITSFSVKPLYMAAYLGFLFSGIGMLYIPYVIYAFITKTEISGWASLIMTIVFFGGVQLIILGIIGIYMGKMFRQLKQRPTYIIRSKNF